MAPPRGLASEKRDKPLPREPAFTEPANTLDFRKGRGVWCKSRFFVQRARGSQNLASAAKADALECGVEPPHSKAAPLAA
jgi:hypothetical protein